MAKKRKRCSRRVDWSVNKFGVVVGGSRLIRHEAKTVEDALKIVQGLPVKDQAEAYVVSLRPVKVETSVQLEG